MLISQTEIVSAMKNPKTDGMVKVVLESLRTCPDVKQEMKRWLVFGRLWCPIHFEPQKRVAGP